MVGLSVPLWLQDRPQRTPSVAWLPDPQPMTMLHFKLWSDVSNVRGCRCEKSALIVKENSYQAIDFSQDAVHLRIKTQARVFRVLGERKRR
jgi:hypothetical protein